MKHESNVTTTQCTLPIIFNFDSFVVLSNRRANPACENCVESLRGFYMVQIQNDEMRTRKENWWPDANTIFSELPAFGRRLTTYPLDWLLLASHSHLFSGKWSQSIFWSIPHWLIIRILFVLIMPAARGKIHSTTPLCCAKVGVVFSVVIYQRFNVVETLPCSV